MDMSRPFPLCLLVPDGRSEAEASRTLDWTQAHNRAVHTYKSVTDGTLGRSALRPAEAAILGLAAGIDAWCTYNRHCASEPFGSTEITIPLFGAFNDALQYELGRLDGGTLADWAAARLRSLGIDPNTNERL